MTISKTNIDTNDKRALYRMTRGESEKVQELHDGDVIAVENYCLYLDDKIDDKTLRKMQKQNIRLLTLLLCTSGKAKSQNSREED